MSNKTLVPGNYFFAGGNPVIKFLMVICSYFEIKK